MDHEGLIRIITMDKNQQEWERRLQELEVEVNPPEPEQSPNLSQQLEKTLNQLRDWYNSLSTPAKAAVTLVGVLVAFSLLNSVLKLVTSLLSTVILALVLYGLYRFLMASNSNQGDG